MINSENKWESPEHNGGAIQNDDYSMLILSHRHEIYDQIYIVETRWFHLAHKYENG